MKVTYYAKIEHLESGLYQLTLPDIPTIEITDHSIDSTLQIAKIILKSTLQSLPELPEEIVYIGEEYYPIVINL